MNFITFPAKVTDWHLVTDSSGEGQNAILTISTSVIGTQTLEVLGLLQPFLDFDVTLRRKGVYEDKPIVGTVSATNAPGRFTFLMPWDDAARHGLALGSFVVTGSGIVAMIFKMRAVTGDLFRLLVQTRTLDAPRQMAEQQPLEYDCIELGGLGIDVKDGEYVYYRTPVFPPLPGESVHAGPGGRFFDVRGQHKVDQSSQLLNQLARVCEMRDVAPDVAVNMLKHAADFSKTDAAELMQEVSGLMLDESRIDALTSAFEANFPGSIV